MMILFKFAILLLCFSFAMLVPISINQTLEHESDNRTKILPTSALNSSYYYKYRQYNAGRRHHHIGRLTCYRCSSYYGQKCVVINRITCTCHCYWT